MYPSEPEQAKLSSPPMSEAAPSNLAAVQGITVGHWTDSQSATGCTVTLAPPGGMRAACAVRCRASGTRDLGALAPRHRSGHIDALLLTVGPARGRLVGAFGSLAQGRAPFARGGAGQNTALAVMATNARLDRVALQALAHAAGDALARRIVPYATPFDGDVVFALSTAQVPAATPLQAEALAALAVPEAVERAVRLARGTRDVPGLADDRA